MDTKSHNTQKSAKNSELEKFQLYFEYVPMTKVIDRRTHATGK
jgi:hypothetical protein